jgi:hypothetical protein
MRAVKSDAIQLVDVNEANIYQWTFLVRPVLLTKQ